MEELGIPWVCVRRLSPRGRRWPRTRSSRGQAACSRTKVSPGDCTEQGEGEGSLLVSVRGRFCRWRESQRIGDGLEWKAERKHQEELHLFIRRANNDSLVSREGKH